MFQPRKRLNWLGRFKFQASMMLGALAVLTIGQSVVQAAAVKYNYNGHDYKHKENFSFARGEMVVFYDTDEICNSYVLVPGVILISNGLLAFFYLLCLLWLFLGISIVSDIFMGAIEVITSSTKSVEKVDPVTRKCSLIFRRNHPRDAEGMEPYARQSYPHGARLQRPRNSALRH